MDLSKLGSADLMDSKDTKSLFPMDTRPAWDSWFMTLAYVIAQRSLDKHTKHGCVVVDDSRTILSVGYNGPPRGCADELIPLERPDKYDYMRHSEENAITNAARTGIGLNGSTFYVTGPPCHSCFGNIINVGAKTIIHGPVLHQRTEAQIKAIELMNADQKIRIVEYTAMPLVINILTKTRTYIEGKLESDIKETTSSNN